VKPCLPLMLLALMVLEPQNSLAADAGIAVGAFSQAVDSGSRGLNAWVAHKRNVRADLREQFGEDIISIDAVALMTDTDNSGGRAQASYGDIWFSAE
jgi:Protein of unknown function (DUF3047)